MYPLTKHDIEARKANMKKQVAKIDARLGVLCNAAIKANNRTSYSVNFNYAGHVRWADLRVYTGKDTGMEQVFGEIAIGWVNDMEDSVGFHYEHALDGIVKELNKIDSIIKYLNGLK